MFDIIDFIIDALSCGELTAIAAACFPIAVLAQIISLGFVNKWNNNKMGFIFSGLFFIFIITGVLIANEANEKRDKGMCIEEKIEIDIQE